MIKFFVEENDGSHRTLEVPADMGLNLMEVLKASDYPIEATCGGMALCATCHVEILSGMENLNSQTDAELDMLDTLPSSSANSRLACQVRVNEGLENVVLRLKG